MTTRFLTSIAIWVCKEYIALFFRYYEMSKAFWSLDVQFWNDDHILNLDHFIQYIHTDGLGAANFAFVIQENFCTMSKVAWFRNEKWKKLN